MTKAELNRNVAKLAGVSQDTANKVIMAFTDVINESLINDRSLQIKDLGTFSLAKRKARKWVNPATRESIDIPAMSTVKFKTCSGLKKSVKNVGQ